MTDHKQRVADQLAVQREVEAAKLREQARSPFPFNLVQAPVEAMIDLIHETAKRIVDRILKDKD